MDFYIKQHDTYPPLSAIIARDADVVDLTGATVQFHMGDVVDSEAEIVDAENGRVRYVWVEGDTDTAGSYRAEFEVTFSDGAIETFPQGGYVSVFIREDLA
jgi:predicted phosphodiesterase